MTPKRHESDGVVEVQGSIPGVLGQPAQERKPCRGRRGISPKTIDAQYKKAVALMRQAFNGRGLAEMTGSDREYTELALKHLRENHEEASRLLGELEAAVNGTK